MFPFGLNCPTKFFGLATLVFELIGFLSTFLELDFLILLLGLDAALLNDSLLIKVFSVSPLKKEFLLLFLVEFTSFYLMKAYSMFFDIIPF